MAWFSRDHTGRALTERERVFLAGLTDVLSEMQPAQVDDRETALTAEGDACHIVLIPHRALGGIAIVVWLTTTEGAVTVAQVGGLDVTHDSLDLGVWVSRVPLEPSTPDFALLLKRIRERLFAPLAVQVYGSTRARRSWDEAPVVRPARWSRADQRNGDPVCRRRIASGYGACWRERMVCHRPRRLTCGCRRRRKVACWAPRLDRGRWADS
jgi:hypothetical protein